MCRYISLNAKLELECDKNEKLELDGDSNETVTEGKM